ncbi:hypothetical protein FJZ40_03750 [Candidatus Shapirobacteria bacterium]|nr:hypothetical protein [Candidatus Shapirobacteria bacterium]
MDKETKKEFQKLSRLVEKNFGLVGNRFDKVEVNIVALKFDMGEVKGEVKCIDQRTDETYKLLDGYVNSQEGFKQEFAAMKHKIGRIEKVIKDELGVEF